MSADSAWRLAQRPELFLHVVSPIVGISDLVMPDTIGPGAEVYGRGRLFGVIPVWVHHLRIVSLEPGEIYTNEHGGPITVWNHRLTFTEIAGGGCRYTDEIEVGDGLRGFLTRGFIAVMFRYRHRRWRRLDAILGWAVVD